MRDLTRLTSKPFDELTVDQIHSIRYSIIVMAEAIGSICTHICLAELDYRPESRSDAVLRVGREKGLKCTEDLVKILRLRNLLVHRYWEIDDRRVYTSVRESFKCVEEFDRSVEEQYGLR